jgi:hypothetical protein
MLREQKILKEQVTTFINNADVTTLEVGNSRVGIGIIIVMAGFLGIWGCACLINGVAQIQSIHEFGRVIFTAFTGL